MSYYSFLENQQPAEKEKRRTGNFILTSKLGGIPNGCRGKVPPALGGIKPRK